MAQQAEGDGPFSHPPGQNKTALHRHGRRAPLRAGVFRHLLLSFLWVGLVPITVLAVLAIIYSTRVSLRGIKNGRLSDTAHACSLLNDELDKYRTSIEVLGSDGELIAFFQTQKPDAAQLTHLNQKLYLIMAGRTDQLRMHVADRRGDICLSTGGIPSEYRLKGQDWGIFRAMRQALGTVCYAENYTVAGRSAERGLTLGAAVRGDGGILGYILLDIPTGAIESLMGRA